MAQWTPDSLINNWFAYHPATSVTGPVHDAVRNRTRTLAIWFNSVLPEGPTKTQALGKLREAMMFANASIACDASEETA